VIHTFPQRGPEWNAYKIGRIGASRISDIIAKTKSGYSTSRANYRAELLCERLTGIAPERYRSNHMEWGIETEAEARAAYAFYSGNNVTEVGFIDHPTIEMCGCSPDGLIGEDGGCEIKSPLTATHIDTLLGAPLPDKYMVQCQWAMACSGRAWWDWVSFDPLLPENARLFVKRIERDDRRIRELEGEVKTFAFELERLVDRVKNYGQA